MMNFLSKLKSVCELQHSLFYHIVAQQQDFLCHYASIHKKTKWKTIAIISWWVR